MQSISEIKSHWKEKEEWRLEISRIHASKNVNRAKHFLVSWENSAQITYYLPFCAAPRHRKKANKIEYRIRVKGRF